MRNLRVSMAMGACVALGTMSAPAQTLTDAECQSLDARFRSDTAIISTFVEFVPSLRAAGGGCGTGPIELKTPSSEHIVTLIDDVIVEGEGLRAYADTGAPPATLIARMEGLRVMPRIDDPVMDFVFAAQYRRNAVDGRLVVTFDREANRLILDELSLDFPGPNNVRASAEASGVDARDRRALLTSVATAKLMTAYVEIETRGLFETYLLRPLAQSVLADTEDAPAAFDAWKEELRTTVVTIPDETVPTASKRAFERLLQDLPNPHGRLRIELAYPGGFGLQEAMALGEIRFMRPDAWIVAPLVARFDYQRDDRAE